jgi:hypothetical protein
MPISLAVSLSFLDPRFFLTIGPSVSMGRRGMNLTFHETGLDV